MNSVAVRMEMSEGIENKSSRNRPHHAFDPLVAHPSSISSDGLIIYGAVRMAMPESMEYTCSQGRPQYMLGPLVARPSSDVQPLVVERRLDVQSSLATAHRYSRKFNDRIAGAGEKHRVCVDFIQARGVLVSLMEKRGISCESPSGDGQVVQCC